MLEIVLSLDHALTVSDESEPGHMFEEERNLNRV